MAKIGSTATAVEAERHRSEGNDHFRSFRYHNAIKSYTRSLECYETSPVLANRAQAYLNTRQYILAFFICYFICLNLLQFFFLRTKLEPLFLLLNKLSELFNNKMDKKTYEITVVESKICDLKNIQISSLKFDRNFDDDIVEIFKRCSLT
uniref:TPR_REGION domain-containing protein n=1 Tax=Elaeophora elaphi TaxID=1147741 RepID=A0A0R3S5Q1_9BILA